MCPVLSQVLPLPSAGRERPAWGVLLYAKTASRCGKIVLYLIIASLSGTLFINGMVRNRALQQLSSGAYVPFLLAAPCGATAALVALYLQLDRAQFASIQQSRAKRLTARIPMIVSLATLAWALGMCATLAVYILTPVRAPRALDCVFAAAAAYIVALCIIASASLTGVVLAERPNLAYLDQADHALVRSSSSMPIEGGFLQLHATCSKSCNSRVCYQA